MIWRDEVYLVDLDQSVGHEPAFRRPAVVVFVDILNNGPDGLVVVVPVTSAVYGLRSHIGLESGSTGLDDESYARCDQLRVISTDRLSSRLGMIGPDQSQSVNVALKYMLDL